MNCIFVTFSIVLCSQKFVLVRTQNLGKLGDKLLVYADIYSTALGMKT